jgi:hypothetical protein
MQNRIPGRKKLNPSAEKYQKEQSPNQGMSCLPTSFFLAEEMGKKLERDQILF